MLHLCHLWAWNEEVCMTLMFFLFFLVEVFVLFMGFVFEMLQY